MFIKNNISSYCGERFCHHEACGFDWNWLNSCWIGSDTHISFRMNFNHSGNPLSFNAVPSSGQHLNVLNILVCLCYSQTQHYLNDGGMKRMSSGVSQHEEWRWSVVWWYGSRCFCILVGLSPSEEGSVFCIMSQNYCLEVVTHVSKCQTFMEV